MMSRIFGLSGTALGAWRPPLHQVALRSCTSAKFWPHLMGLDPSSGKGLVSLCICLTACCCFAHARDPTYMRQVCLDRFDPAPGANVQGFWTTPFAKTGRQTLLSYSVKSITSSLSEVCALPSQLAYVLHLSTLAKRTKSMCLSAVSWCHSMSYV